MNISSQNSKAATTTATREGKVKPPTNSFFHSLRSYLLRPQLQHPSHHLDTLDIYPTPSYFNQIGTGRHPHRINLLDKRCSLLFAKPNSQQKEYRARHVDWTLNYRPPLYTRRNRLSCTNYFNGPNTSLSNRIQRVSRSEKPDTGKVIENQGSKKTQGRVIAHKCRGVS